MDHYNIFSKAIEFCSWFTIYKGFWRKTTILVGWKPPPIGYVKINVDGVVTNNPGEVGLGGVFRTCEGDWTLGFCQKLVHTTK